MTREENSRNGSKLMMTVSCACFLGVVVDLVVVVFATFIAVQVGAGCCLWDNAGARASAEDVLFSWSSFLNFVF